MINRKSAFTLIEILVALTIFGIGILILFNIFPSAWHAFSYSRTLNRLSLFAQQKLEEVKSLETLSPGRTSGTDNGLSWVLDIAPVELEPGVALMRVQLDVEFIFLKSAQRERFLTYRGDK